MIKVGKKWDPGAIDITRGHSPLGNPFYLHNARDSAARDVVCDQYQEWFDDKVAHRDPEVIRELVRLYKMALSEDVILGCYCAPRRCHGDTIQRFLTNLVQRTNDDVVEKPNETD